MRRFSLVLFLLLMSALQAAPNLPAPPTHGLALHGDLKHGPDFKGFDLFSCDAKKGGAIALPVVGRVFDSLNPFVTKGKVAEGLGMYHYLPFDTLMAKSPEEPFSVYGRLAEKVSLAPDHSRMIFFLDKRARFHDGSPVTAQDVAFTFHTFAEKGTPLRRLMAKKIADIIVHDAHTVEFIFKKPEAGRYEKELPFVIATMPVLSKEDLEGKDFENTDMNPLMGSGPYRIGEIDPGKSITYVRDPNYWGWDLPVMQGQYNFDKITYQYYGSDVICFQAFKAGDVHFWTETDPMRWKVGYDFPAAQKGEVKKATAFFNDAAVVAFLVMNTRRPIFKDWRVRKALFLLYDFNWVNQHLFHNMYVRENGSFFGRTELAAKTSCPDATEKSVLESLLDVPPQVFGSLPQLPQTDGSGYNRAQVKQSLALFQEAGWEVKNGKLLHKKTGQPFEFEILLSDAKNEKITQAFVRNLKRVGITATIRVVDTANYKNRLNNFDFDMMMYPYGHSLSPGAEQTLYWSSKMADVPSRNYAGVRSPAIDTLCTRIDQVKDRAELVTLTRVLDRLLRHGFYGIPLYQKACDRFAYWSFLCPPRFNNKNVPMIYAWWHEVKDKS